jgi:UDP-N-acetyl-D-glucosamine/UDP-N-acetyl-D-galactosamine dehydrogenase
MFQDLISKKAKLSVVGLGYVGLPIALEFSRKMSVIGFDIRPDRVDLMKKGIDPSKELESEAFNGTDILFTANPDDLKQAQFHVVAVPTPINKHNLPDLTPLLSATRTVGKALKKGDIVVFESTVYPGCTEEDCVPILEKESGLKFNIDFKVGYSPERINPGDKEHTLTKILKIVSGSDAESLGVIADVYGSIIKAAFTRPAP